EALAYGKFEDGLQSFSKAVDIDQNFGLAYQGMAVASRNLRRQQDAEKYINLALKYIDRMTEREKYRTRGSYYLLVGDRQKCVEEYTKLINRFASDAGAHNNLAVCASVLRNMPKALEHARLAAAILPKRPAFRYNVALFAAYASDFQTAETEARAVQALDPSSPLGLRTLAFAQMGQGQLLEAAETYQKLEKFGNIEASRARSGFAHLALYEGRLVDAARILEQGVTEDLAAKLSDRAAAKFAVLGYIRLLQNNNKAAISAAESALAGSKNVDNRFFAGRVFAAAGQTARAQALAADLAKELQPIPQAYAKLIEGE